VFYVKYVDSVSVGLKELSTVYLLSFIAETRNSQIVHQLLDTVCNLQLKFIGIICSHAILICEIHHLLVDCIVVKMWL